MTFEGQQIQGAPKILEKLQSLTFQKINRVITAVDSQPMVSFEMVSQNWIMIDSVFAVRWRCAHQRFGKIAGEFDGMIGSG